MGQATVTALGEAERLAQVYAPANLQARYHAFFMFDALLGSIARSVGEPLPAQLKLAWWRDACGRLPDAREHPVLEALGECSIAPPPLLVALVDAWEEVAVAEHDPPCSVEAVAKARSALIQHFTSLPDADVENATRLWTLVGLSAQAAYSGESAGIGADGASISLTRLPRRLRPLAVLAGLAQRSAARGGGPLLGDRLSPLVAIRLGIFGR